MCYVQFLEDRDEGVSALDLTTLTKWTGYQKSGGVIIR